MATQLVLMWLLAVTLSVFAALADIAAAAAAPTTASISSAEDLHRQLVKGFRGKWTSLWEYPIQRELAAAAAFHQQQHQALVPIGDGDALLRKDLETLGFGIGKINGTIQWTTSPNANTAATATPTGFGDGFTDDTLVWSFIRPDHSGHDTVAVFEAPTTLGADNDEDRIPSYYFPFLDAQLLSRYDAFEGYYYPRDTSTASAGSSAGKQAATGGSGDSNGLLDLPRNAYVRAGLKRATEAIKGLTSAKTEALSSSSTAAAAAAAIKVPPTPSYGYVLCSHTSTVVHTNAHRTEEGEEFTKSRRVVVATAEEGSAAQLRYVTKVVQYSGYIFPLTSVADAKLKGDAAAARYCGGSSSASSSSSLTPLTITTVGAAVKENGSVGALATGGGGSVVDGNEKKGATQYWELDSVVFEFGLLPHEKEALAQSEKRAKAEEEEAKKEKKKAAAAKTTEADEETVTDAKKAGTTQKTPAEVMKTYYERQSDLLAKEAGDNIFATHPIVAQLLKKGSDENADGILETSTLLPTAASLFHRVTLRRLQRTDDRTFTERMGHYVDTYWQTVVVAMGFVFFRYYVGYRYNSKKQKRVREVLVTEESKLLAASGKK